jgi:hypothetical protein
MLSLLGHMGFFPYEEAKPYIVSNDSGNFVATRWE